MAKSWLTSPGKRAPSITMALFLLACIGSAGLIGVKAHQNPEATELAAVRTSPSLTLVIVQNESWCHFALCSLCPRPFLGCLEST